MTEAKTDSIKSDSVKSETKAEAGKFAAAISEAFEKVRALDVPESAREFMANGVAAARTRVDDMHANGLKAADAAETALGKGVANLVFINRKFQEAAFEDGVAFLNAVEKFASARSWADAIKVPVAYARERNDVALTRVKSAVAYLADAASAGAKDVQVAADEAVVAVKEQAEKVAKSAKASRKAA